MDKCTKGYIRGVVFIVINGWLYCNCFCLNVGASKPVRLPASSLVLIHNAENVTGPSRTYTIEVRYVHVF